MCILGLFAHGGMGSDGPEGKWLQLECCHWGLRSGMFRFFDQKVVCCVLFFPILQCSLRLPQPNNFADRQYARIHRAASDLLLVTCNWRYCCRFWASMVSVVFRLVRSWLSYNGGFWLRLFVTRFWLAEVG